MRIDALVVSCEHARNRVPARYASLFDSRRARAALSGHRGYDPGALVMARALGRRFGVDVIAADVTRLLVEPNRSPGHPGIFSEFSRALDARQRQAVLAAYYSPHRERVRHAVAQELARGCCTLHLAVHSFTPRLHGEVRKADIGLLYDPQRSAERAFCARLASELAAFAPELRVRRNYPYRGRDDGLTTWLRREFGGRAYLGIELEVNQVFHRQPRRRRHLTRVLSDSLARLLALSAAA